MRTEAAAQVIARIEAEQARAPGGALAFDGDGTLWSGDVGEDFFAAILESGALRDEARVALAHEAALAGIAAEGGAVELARRIHAAYLAGDFDEERVCEIMTWIAAGWTRAALDAFAERVTRGLGLEARLHEEAIVVVEWARRRNVPVYLVSASPRAIVEQAARVVGVPVERVSAATEARDASGVVLAEVVRPIPYGPGKVARLREQLGKRPLYAAFGDNAFDLAMLDAALVPVAVRPKPRLLERAGGATRVVTLARA